MDRRQARARECAFNKTNTVICVRAPSYIQERPFGANRNVPNGLLASLPAPPALPALPCLLAPPAYKYNGLRPLELQALQI